MRKKRIITSALIGTIALVGLSVSLTLAWYGASDRLQLSPIDITVNSKAELKISTERDGDYLSSIDLSPKLGEETEVFVPVSSMNKNEWMSNQESTPKFYDSSSSAIYDDGTPYLHDADYGFFQKRLFLKTSMDRYVTLDVTKDDEEDKDYCKFDIIPGDEEGNGPGTYKRAIEIVNELKEKYHIEKTKEEIYEKLYNLIKCIRVSILVIGDEEHPYYNYYIVNPMKNIGTDAEGNTIFEKTELGGVLDNNRDGYYDYRLDKSDGNYKEIVYGEIVNNDRSRIQYDDPIDLQSTQPSRKTNEELGPHYLDSSFEADHREIAYRFNREESGAIFAIEDSMSLEEIANKNTNRLLIPCYSNVPTEIVVSIYVEGWDRDCINATMGAYFKTELSFELFRGF